MNLLSEIDFEVTNFRTEEKNRKRYYLRYYLLYAINQTFEIMFSAIPIKFKINSANIDSTFFK